MLSPNVLLMGSEVLLHDLTLRCQCLLAEEAYFRMQRLKCDIGVCKLPRSKGRTMANVFINLRGLVSFMLTVLFPRISACQRMYQNSLSAPLWANYRDRKEGRRENKWKTGWEERREVRGGCGSDRTGKHRALAKSETERRGRRKLVASRGHGYCIL